MRRCKQCLSAMRLRNWVCVCQTEPCSVVVISQQRCSVDNYSTTCYLLLFQLQPVLTLVTLLAARPVCCGSCCWPGSHLINHWLIYLLTDWFIVYLLHSLYAVVVVNSTHTHIRLLNKRLTDRNHNWLQVVCSSPVLTLVLTLSALTSTINCFME